MPVTLISVEGERVSVDDALAQRSPLLRLLCDDGNHEVPLHGVDAATLRLVVGFLRLFHACPLDSMDCIPGEGHLVQYSIPCEFLDLFPNDLGAQIRLISAALYLDVPELVQLCKIFGYSAFASLMRSG